MKIPVLESPIFPLFVVGMNGSGTSMLTESLGRHPQLYSFPGETRMIPHYISVAERYGDLNIDDNFRKFWQYIVSSSMDFSIFNGHRVPELPENWREFPRSLASILDAVYRQFAFATGKTRWCEKSPNNSEHILRIGDLFPEAMFIQIIRDGRDCAASTNRRQFRNPRLTIQRWRQTVSETQRQGELLGDRYMQLKYEDLTENPEFWMREICEFTNLGFDTKVLESAMPQSAKRVIESVPVAGKIEPNSRKFLSYFPPEQLADLELIAGDFLNQLGYDTYHVPGSKNIGKFRAKIYRLVDFVRANAWLRRKLSGNTNVSWGDVFRSILASIREYSAKKI